MGIQDYTADLSSARLAQLDQRIADLDAEKAELTEKREAYAPKKSRPAKKD
jgi:hypothetical protein